MKRWSRKFGLGLGWFGAVSYVIGSAGAFSSMGWFMGSIFLLVGSGCAWCAWEAGRAWQQKILIRKESVQPAKNIEASAKGPDWQGFSRNVQQRRSR